MSKVSMADVLALSFAERIQLAEDIWDSLVEMPRSVVLTDAQRVELDRRLEDYRFHPNDGISWNSLKESLLGQR